MFEHPVPPLTVDPTVTALAEALDAVVARQHGAEALGTPGWLAGAGDVVTLLRLAEAAQAAALRSLAAFTATGGYAIAHPELGTHPHATAAAFLQQTLHLSADDARARVRLAGRLSPRGDLAPLTDLILTGLTATDPAPTDPPTSAPPSGTAASRHPTLRRPLSEGSRAGARSARHRRGGAGGGGFAS